MNCLMGSVCKSMYCNSNKCHFKCQGGAKCPKITCGTEVKYCKLLCSNLSLCNFGCENRMNTNCTRVTFNESIPIFTTTTTPTHSLQRSEACNIATNSTEMLLFVMFMTLLLSYKAQVFV